MGTNLARRPWTEIHNWVYWLDGPRLAEIGRTAFELAVIDYSADGTAEHEFSAAEIEALRHAGCERRVLAYLSVGEAEDYRFYWQSNYRAGNPTWLMPENRAWEGNFLVRYWEPEWQALVLRYLDRIIAQGFDGIYLDRVDAFQDWHATGHEQDMVDFVRALATYARTHSPLADDFGVFVQNAEELVVRHPDYAALVTGIGREEVYVRATNEVTPPAEQRQTEGCLRVFRERSRGRLVLTVDYADRLDLIRMAYTRARAEHFIPYVAGVDLDRIQLNQGYEPSCSAWPCV